MMKKALLTSGALMAIAFSSASMAAEGTDKCGRKIVETKDRESLCMALTQPQDVTMETLKYKVINPNAGGCDLGSFKIPGFPDFSYDFSADAFCNIAQSITAPMLDQASQYTQGLVDGVIDKATFGLGTNINVDASLDAVKNGNVIGTSKGGNGSTIYDSTNSLLDTFNQITNSPTGGN